MEKYSNKKEIILILIMIVLAVVATDPFSLLMPSMFQMTAALVLLVVYIIFSVFIWKEKSEDEREELHRLKSGKTAFSVGALVLILGIVYQIFSHMLDSWLVVALVAMVSAKAWSLYKSKLEN